MHKSQQRGNREQNRPKQVKKPAAQPSSTTVTQAKPPTPVSS